MEAQTIQGVPNNVLHMKIVGIQIPVPKNFRLAFVSKLVGNVLTVLCLHAKIYCLMILANY